MLKDLNSHWHKFTGYGNLDRKSWKLQQRDDHLFSFLSDLTIFEDKDCLFDIYDRMRCEEKLDPSPKVFKKVLK